MDTKHPNEPTRLPRMSTPRYEPKVGDIITIELPDERTRGQIERVISDDAVIAKLMVFTTGRDHQYRKGDLIPCRFDGLSMNAQGWRVVSQREMDEAEAAREAAKPKKGKRKA